MLPPRVLRVCGQPFWLIVHIDQSPDIDVQCTSVFSLVTQFW